MTLSGIYIGSNLEAKAGINFVITDMVLQLMASGTGSAVGSAGIEVLANTTITLDGNGRLYDDDAGTVNESTSKVITPGAVRYIYFRLPSGLANLTIVSAIDRLYRIESFSSPVNAPYVNQFDIRNIPPSMYRLVNGSTNYISGTIASLKPFFTSIWVMGNNTITGDLNSLRSSFNLQLAIGGNNTISGSLGDIPSALVHFQLQGNNTVTGDLSMLKPALYHFWIQGTGAISGNLNALPRNLNLFGVINLSNTVTGDLANLPSTLTYFRIQGNHTLYGSLNSLPSGIINFDFVNGAGPFSYTLGKSWNPSMNYFRFNPGSNGLSSTQMDNLIIDLNNIAWAGTSKALKLQGANAARTAASNAAVTSLQGKGVVVTTN